MLTDEQWLRIADLLPGKAPDKELTAVDNRLFVKACSTWSEPDARGGTCPRSSASGPLPACALHGGRPTESGIASRALQGDADLEELFIDATIVRAHQHAAGARKNDTHQAKPSDAPVARPDCGASGRCYTGSSVDRAF